MSQTSGGREGLARVHVFKCHCGWAKDADGDDAHCVALRATLARPADAGSQEPMARTLRVCASRIDAGEPWREALADYGLVLVPAPAPTDQAGVREALEACRLAFDSIEDIQRQGYTVDEAIGEQARRRTVALNLMSAALTQPPRPPGADWADELAEWASHLTCQHSDLICVCIKERLAVMLTRPQASEPAHCDACLIANGHSAELETHCDGVPPRPPEGEQ